MSNWGKGYTDGLSGTASLGHRVIFISILRWYMGNRRETEDGELEQKEG